MKQRLVMASALMHAPRILIVDEPTVGMDPRGARLLKRIFRDLAADGATVFMSTHSLEVAEELCDRVGIILRGQLCVVPPLLSVAGATEWLPSSSARAGVPSTGTAYTRPVIRSVSPTSTRVPSPDQPTMSGELSGVWASCRAPPVALTTWTLKSRARQRLRTLRERNPATVRRPDGV